MVGFGIYERVEMNEVPITSGLSSEAVMEFAGIFRRLHAAEAERDAALVVIGQAKAALGSLPLPESDDAEPSRVRLTPAYEVLRLERELWKSQQHVSYLEARMAAREAALGEYEAQALAEWEREHEQREHESGERILKANHDA